MELPYEDNALLRCVARSHDCARSRRNTDEATDCRREAARSGEAEAPVGCKLVGTVKGTKLWAGECTSLELRTDTQAEEFSRTSVPEAAAGTTPKDQQ